MPAFCTVAIVTSGFFLRPLLLVISFAMHLEPFKLLLEFPVHCSLCSLCKGKLNYLWITALLMGLACSRSSDSEEWREV